VPERATRRTRLVVAGNPAHVAPHVLDARRQGHLAFVVTSRPALRCGIEEVEQGTWFEVDLTDRDAVADAFRRIGESGGIDLVVYVGADPEPDVPAELIARGFANVIAASAAARSARLLLAHAGETDDPERRAVEDAEDALLRSHRPALSGTRIRFVPRPRLLLTGASGFLGRHLVEALRDDYRIVAMARSSQSYCGVPQHPNVSWMQVDICDRAALADAFSRLRETGGLDFVIHLAAYYDFTGEPHPEYERTNVVALESLLEECRGFRLRRFVFASSLAASEFPLPGVRLDESSAPDGRHPYAVTKRRGEQLLLERFPDVPSVIVRLAAIYSDWLEYPPLFVSFERWRSSAWDRSILGGHGRFAIPYLHVRDVQTLVQRTLEAHEELGPGEVLVASPDEPTSLHCLYDLVAGGEEGKSPRAPYLPAPLCHVGMVARDLFGRALGNRPFERPWMSIYIDRTMPVDGSRTRVQLSWAPRPRLALERRLPLLLANRAANPAEWQRRNQAVLDRNRTGRHLELHAILERLEPAVVARLAECPPAGAAAAADDWGTAIAYEQLRAAVRNRDAFGFATYCELLAERRFDQGALPREVDAELAALESACLETVRSNGASTPMGSRVEEVIALAIRLGRDQVEERFEELRLHPHRRAG